MTTHTDLSPNLGGPESAADESQHTQPTPDFTYMEAAAEIAKQLNVRTYTIGIGSRGLVRMPVQTAPGGRRIIQRMQSQIDTVTLETIAEMTGGKFFEATDGSKLEGIYAQTDG